MVARNVTEKLIEAHLVDGTMRPGEEIALAIDQTLTQDATGTLVMLELEALGLDRVRTELSAQYVDHNLIQADARNPDDHLFLASACRRFGVWFSRPGNGVSHPVHMHRFGAPGKSLLGSDSHSCAAGSLGMLAIGAGGLEVAMAMAGEPFRVRMPEVWGVKLTGTLPDWVSAKDVILEMLRRHGVDGGLNRVVEYYGPGLSSLSAMDRHVIANMGAELGATTTVFPADEETKRFLQSEGRGADWRGLAADDGAAYDEYDEIDLSSLEPLIATPSSPGNVMPVEEVAGGEIYQAYLGSSANPGYRDFAVPALMLDGRTVAPDVSLDVNPTSRQLLVMLMRDGHLARLIDAGARLHQAGCNGRIGMGQAPASGRNSLRTVPRNFPARSGTADDAVYLCSPETATASALTGRITDPRELNIDHPRASTPDRPTMAEAMLSPPLPPEEAKSHALVKSASIGTLPDLGDFPDDLHVAVIIKLGDHISTDEILPGGAEVLPYRSNIDELAAFCFRDVDKSYVDRARGLASGADGHVIIGGRNYGQGSSREHAALAPRHLGLRAVLAKSFARIHRDNLANVGVLPLVFETPSDYDRLEAGDELAFSGLHRAIAGDRPAEAVNGRDDRPIPMRHDLAPHQREVLLAGGLINWKRERL